MNRLIQLWFGLAVVALGLTPARGSRAADCVTDLDCPGSECGGQVCQWLSTTSHVCQPAGSKSRGSDGWCNTVSDCKCQSLGARCNAQFSCSFVQPSDAPATGGAGGIGGASGAASAGASGAAFGGTSGSDAGGSESGGATASGGANANANGAASGDPARRPDGPITGAPSAPEAGGCAVAISVVPGRGVSALLALLTGASVLFRRKRH